MRNAFYSDLIANFPYRVVRYREQIMRIVDFKFVDFFGKRNTVVFFEFLAYVGLIVSEMIVYFVYRVEMREARRQDRIALEHKFVMVAVFFLIGYYRMTEQIYDDAIVVFFHFFYILRGNVCLSVFLEVLYVAF